MNPQKEEKARLQFQKGNFWTGAKKQSTQDIHKCWPDFLKCEYSIGVVRIDPSDSSDVAVVKNGMFTSTSYIAYRQGSLIPYLPVKGLAENTLFRDYIMDAIANEQSLGASNTFIEMANKWNERARGAENGIYKKQLIHLVRKYKNYRKIRSKEDAINNPDAIELLNAVERLPPLPTNGDVAVDEFFESSGADSAEQDESRSIVAQDGGAMIDAEEMAIDGVNQTVTHQPERYKRKI